MDGVPRFIKRVSIPFVSAWSEQDLERLRFIRPLNQNGIVSNEVKQEQGSHKDPAGDKPEVVVLKRKGARRQSGS
jgi:hypothetical protein